MDVGARDGVTMLRVEPLKAFQEEEPRLSKLAFASIALNQDLLEDLIKNLLSLIQDLTFHQSPNVLPEVWTPLDSQPAASVFASRLLLSDIRDAKNQLLGAQTVACKSTPRSGPSETSRMSGSTQRPLRPWLLRGRKKGALVALTAKTRDSQQAASQTWKS